MQLISNLNFIGLILQIIGVVLAGYATKRVIIAKKAMYDDKIMDSKIFDTNSKPTPDESQPREPKTRKPVYEIQGMPNKIIIALSVSLIVIGLALQTIAVPLSDALSSSTSIIHATE